MSTAGCVVDSPLAAVPTVAADGNSNRRGIVIRFDSVTKLYPDQATAALHDLSLEIEKGEFVFLVGPSGSGKSTFLRLVLKEERPTSGRIRVAGKDLHRLSNWKVPQLRRRIGTVFQDFRLLPNKTIFENVAFALQVIGKSRRQINRDVPAVLDLVGLGGKEDRRPDQLSGGEQQRVALARAFVIRPRLLFADEPTGNLDRETGATVVDMLEELNREARTTLVMVTHNLVLAERAHRVIRLSGGSIMSDRAGGEASDASGRPSTERPPR
jgi:cell division transport system ATP-binding protein